MKTKSTTSAQLTIDDINQLLAQYASDCFEQERLHADLDAELTAVREKHAPRINPILARIHETHQTVKAWAEANRAEIFPGKKKSLALLHAVIGFNIGQPTLTLLRGFKWDAVIDLLKKCRLSQYIRTREEVDKKTLLAQRANPFFDFARLGLKVTQSESFYIKPIATQTDTVAQQQPVEGRATASPTSKAA